MRLMSRASSQEHNGESTFTPEHAQQARTAGY
jgi:hypothetical protein